MHAPRSRAFALALLLSTSASAQDAEPRGPDVRVDVDVPAIGAAVWPGNGGDGEGTPALAIGAWVTHRSGHGAMLRVTSLAFAFGGFYVSAEWGGVGVEAAYQCQIALSGDLRTGIALGPYLGFFAGTMLDHGPGAGPLGGINLSFRMRHFELGLDLSHRLVVTRNEIAYEGLAVHGGLAATLRVAFSLY